METNNQTPLVNNFLIEIKKNKKYKNIDDDIIKTEIFDYLKKNLSLKSIKKLDIKEIRKHLHRLYSSYQATKKNKKRYVYLEKLKNSIEDKDFKEFNEIIKRLLTLTISTKERLNYYEKFYNDLFKITKIPKTIIDLGAGLNPLSIPLMHIKEIKYYSYDIDNEDISFLNKFYEIVKPLGIKGIASILDIRNLEKLNLIPNSDIIFLWKIIDLVNTKDHKPGEEIIKSLINKTKFIIASFSTKTLSGKSMNIPRRKGFEIMLERIGLEFKTIKISNEIFYVIFDKLI
jgi:hypothetical protein